MAFIGLAGLRDMIGRASYMEMCLAQIVTVVGLEFTLVPAVILYRTTSSFLRGRAVADSHLGAGGAPKTNEATDLGEEAETLNGLSCGETFAVADQCPKCGWSFTDAG